MKHRCRSNLLDQTLRQFQLYIMESDTFEAVDRYFVDLLNAPDAALESALEAGINAGLPDIQVSAAQGKFLNMLIRLSGATRVLELGTLGAYSTIWMARALPENGRLITLEFESLHVEVARRNLTQAGLDRLVEVIEGAALDSLPKLVAQCEPAFDFIFLDADKESYPDYLPWLVKLSRPGTLIIADNVVREGAVIDPTSSDPRVQGVRKFNDMVAANPKLDASALQAVGAKGYDGFLMAIVK